LYASRRSHRTHRTQSRVAGSSVRFLAWNILHGGGAFRLPEIILSVVRHRPDVVVLTEFRAARGSQIRAVLADHGLCHQASSHGGDGSGNGVLIASRLSLAMAVQTGPCGSEGRWLEVGIPEHSLHVVGVHVPDDTRRSEKSAFWQRLVALGRSRLVENCLILGDFNTGRRHQDGPTSQMGAAQTTGCEALLGSLLSLGFVDAWRRLNPDGREPSWVSPAGEGRRIDAAYLSPRLAPVLQAASYSHFERERRQSDHAPLLLDLELVQPDLQAPAPSPAGPRPGGLFGGLGV
jgi:exodeoxyribonuclease-3